MKRVARWSLIGAGVAVAALFGMDATTFTLRMADPVRGRPRGCYVLLDDLFGAMPSTFRLAEVIIAVASFGLALALTISILRRDRAVRGPSA